MKSESPKKAGGHGPEAEWRDPLFGGGGELP